MTFPMPFNVHFKAFRLLTVRGGFVHADMRFNFGNCYNRETPVNITIKTDKLNTGTEYQKSELNAAMRKESFASRCETLLLHD